LLTIENCVKDKGKSGGIASICKQCNYNRSKQWKKDNPQKVKLQKQKERHSAKQDPRRRSQAIQWSREWYQKQRNLGIEGKLKILLYSIRARVKKGKIAFDLDIDYLASISTENCPIDGLPLDWEMNSVTKGKATDRSPSLDRIIPSLGYVKGNVKFIANKWNTWKSNMLVRDLELIIAYMEKHSP
jgi:hypothetical protein